MASSAIAHSTPIGSIQVLANHMIFAHMQALVWHVMGCFTVVYLDSQTAVGVGEIRIWQITVILIKEKPEYTQVWECLRYLFEGAGAPFVLHPPPQHICKKVCLYIFAKCRQNKQKLGCVKSLKLLSLLSLNSMTIYPHTGYTNSCPSMDIQIPLILYIVVNVYQHRLVTLNA